MTAEVVRSVTTELTTDEIRDDPAWLDDMTILVTSNLDKAVLTKCAAQLYAKRHGRLLFLWKRVIKTDVPSALHSLIHDEDANPQLFAYFVAGAPAHVLDNNNGNVGSGVANGTRCRMRSIAWDGHEKTEAAAGLVELARLKGETLIDLPFPPDFINVRLLDEDGDELSSDQWPSANNLETRWLRSPAGELLRKASVIIPIGIASTKGKKRTIRLGQGVLSAPYEVEFTQHAVDITLVMAVWKARGSTLKRVLLNLESACRHAP